MLVFRATLQALGGSVKREPPYGLRSAYRSCFVRDRCMPRQKLADKSAPAISDVLDVNDFDFEGQCLASQWMVEVHGNLAVVEGFYNPRQLGIGGVFEDHQQALGQLHAFEL